MKFIIEFDRIGRNHYPDPLETKAESYEHLADKIFLHVRGKMASRGIEVALDPEAGTGVIMAGWHEAGRFTVKEMRYVQ